VSRFKLKLELFANFGQFIYSGNIIQNGLGPRPTVSSSAGDGTGQTGQDIPDTNSVSARVADGGETYFPEQRLLSTGAPPSTITPATASSLIPLPGGISPANERRSRWRRTKTGSTASWFSICRWEVGWKLWDLPMRIFGDFAVNFDADDRAQRRATRAVAVSGTPMKSVWAWAS